MSDQSRTSGLRRVTVEMSPELYASLVVVKLQTGRSLKQLMCDAATQLVEAARAERARQRYRTERGEGGGRQ